MQDSISKILEAAADGVIVIGDSGRLLYINQSAKRVCGFSDDVIGRNYAAVMQDLIAIEENDEFYQYIINAILNRDAAQKGDVSFIGNGGKKYRLHLTASYYDDETVSGVVIQFSDITEIELERKTRLDSTVVFVTILSVSALWNYLYGLWDYTGRPVPVGFLPPIMYAMGLVTLLILWKTTDLPLKDVGLGTVNLKQNIRVNVFITIAGLVIMVLLKLILLAAAPGFFQGKPFVNFAAQRPWQYLYYILSVFLQQFISQGIIHENLRRILYGKHKAFFAYMLSLLFFGAMHIHYGIIYMVAGTVLLAAIGGIYIKQRSIWGILIPHYVLGTALVVLGYV